MWLLDTKTLKLKYVVDYNHVSYAILSHRWRDEEVLFRDMETFDSCTKTGAAKVRSACQIARDDGHGFIWIDTCCIDKSSSAELSEAINSMYAWYQSSEICYAYLSDISPQERFITDSDWFGRCWTLQELIAPTDLVFLDNTWRRIVRRSDLCDEISYHTHIPREVLSDGAKHLKDCGVAQKMSWAAHRDATRTEDYAYSLLGIFNIHMPLIYGEGWEAFRRLQQAIVEATDDLTILIFEDHHEEHLQPKGLYRHTLALTPRQFAKCSSVKAIDTYHRFGYCSPIHDISLEIKRPHLVLTTFVAKVTDNIYAAFITGTSYQSRVVYALLLKKHYAENHYFRLNSPSGLLGTSTSDIDDLGIWSPPPGYIEANLPTYFARKRLVIAPDQDAHDDSLIDYRGVKRCGFEIPDLVNIRSAGILTRLRQFLLPPQEIILAPGALHDPENDKLVWVDIQSKRGQYIAVCNVHFGANSQGLLLAHLAIKVDDLGAFSPICIILDSTFPWNNSVKHATDDTNAYGPALSWNDVRNMQVDYTRLCCQVPKTQKEQSLGSHTRHDYPRSWMYVGHECHHQEQLEHFIMHKGLVRDGSDAALLYGRVELEVSADSGKWIDLRAYIYEACRWRVKFEECYGGLRSLRDALEQRDAV